MPFLLCDQCAVRWRCEAYMKQYLDHFVNSTLHFCTQLCTLHTCSFWAEVCDLGRTSCRKIKKLKFSTLTHECRASWVNVCLISSPWLYIIHCIRQKASWWLIHRATGRIRESASEKELRSQFFQRGAFKALLGFLGSECSRWHQQCDGVTPFTGKTWMNRNGKNWALLLFCSPCGFRFLGT